MQKETGSEKFGTCFRVIFVMFDMLIFDFWRKDKMPYFLNILNFLRLVLSFSTTREATRI